MCVQSQMVHEFINFLVHNGGNTCMTNNKNDNDTRHDESILTSVDFSCIHK